MQILMQKYSFIVLNRHSSYNANYNIERASERRGNL